MPHTIVQIIEPWRETCFGVKVAGGQVSLISMHLWKAYVRSATADTENARNIHEEAA